jgi:uncharacterized iron-regulated membrane protein
MGKNQARQVWVVIHRWVGLLAGAWLVVVGLSGSFLAFYPEIDRALNPDWSTPQSRGEPLPMQRVLDSAREAMPGRFLHSVFPPDGPSDVHHVWFTPSAEDQGRMWEVLVDPNDGRVLGQREAVPTMEFSRRNIANAVYTLHYNLFLGNAGSTLVGFVGLFALVSSLTGVVLWWPRGGRGWSQALRIKAGARGVRLHFDLHRVAAVYSVALLFLVALTGVTLTFGSQTRAVLGLVSPVRPPPGTTLPNRSQALVDADVVLARTAAEFPRSRVRCLWLPQASGPAWRVTLVEPRGIGWAGGRAELWLHPADASLIEARRHGEASAAEAYLAWQLPLHNGRVLGLPGRIAVCVLGFVPLLLAVTGALIWWRKRHARDIARTQVARPSMNQQSS